MNGTACCVIVLALMTCACQSLENTPAEIPLRELLASNQCAVSEAKLQLPEDGAEALALTSAHRIGAQPVPLDIDRDKERILLVAAGHKPSAGYRLQLTSHSASLRNGVLRLPVVLSGPGGNYQAAMITSPCLLLAVQRGQYRRIVADKLGLELELSED